MTGASGTSSPMPRRRLLAYSILGTATAALTACAPAVTPPNLKASDVQRRLRVSLAAMPFTLDPAFATDASATRILRQCTQTLIGTDPGTGAPAPRLASGFSLASSGRVLSLTLKEGLRFHDGSAFDAEAVKANFERLYRMPQALWSRFPRNPFRELFGAHEGEKQPSLYTGCVVTGAHSLDLHISRAIPELVAALSQAGFSMISPAQCAQRQKEGSSAATGPTAFLPAGTGPFRLSKSTASSITLEPAENTAAAPGSAVAPASAVVLTGLDFTVLHQSQARLRALLRGDVDVADLVTPSMGAALAQSTQHTYTRDSYAISYLGMNAAHPALASARVRSAVGQIITRGDLLRFHLKGSLAAHSFFPYRLEVDTDYFPDLPTPLSAADARTLLKAAGYSGEPLRFVYPVGDSSQTLPEPEKIYARLALQLQTAGMNIVPVPVPWGPEYLKAVLEDENRAFHLHGITGAYIDPGFFVNALFSSPRAEFGFDDAQLRTLLAVARSTVGLEDRREAYKRVNDRLLALVPALPLVNPVNAMAAQDDISPLTLSPVLDDSFAAVTFVQGT